MRTRIITRYLRWRALAAIAMARCGQRAAEAADRLDERTDALGERYDIPCHVYHPLAD